MDKRIDEFCRKVTSIRKLFTVLATMYNDNKLTTNEYQNLKYYVVGILLEETDKED